MLNQATIDKMVEMKMLSLAEEFRRQGIDAACEMTFGNDAAEEILTEAEHQRADLIVVGSAGHSRLRQALLGSMSTNLVRARRFPVLIAPVR